MNTEKEVVYSILNTLRGSHSDNNDLISTRLIRSWIASERANILLQFTSNGRSISEENYQYSSDVVFSKESNGLYKKILPKIIFFNRNTGIRISHNGVTVSMIRKSDAKFYDKNSAMKNKPYAYTIGTTLFVKLPNETASQINLDIDAVYFYPSDVSGYDWQSNLYPIQNELVNVLKKNVLNNEQYILSAPNDQINDFIEDENNSKKK